MKPKWLVPVGVAGGVIYWEDIATPGHVLYEGPAPLQETHIWDNTIGPEGNLRLKTESELRADQTLPGGAKYRHLRRLKQANLDEKIQYLIEVDIDGTSTHQHRPQSEYGERLARGSRLVS